MRSGQAGGSTTVHTTSATAEVVPASAVAPGHDPDGWADVSPAADVISPEPVPAVADREVTLAGSDQLWAVELVSTQ